MSTEYTRVTGSYALLGGRHVSAALTHVPFSSSCNDGAAKQGGHNTQEMKLSDAGCAWACACACVCVVLQLRALCGIFRLSRPPSHTLKLVQLGVAG